MSSAYTQIMVLEIAYRIFYTLNWTLLALGCILGMWGLFRILFWDRSRGRKRCPRCWYSMEGAVEDEDHVFVCPECGWRVSKIRLLYKTRRRWRWLVVPALVFLMAATGIVGQNIRREGWNALPSWMLIEALAWSDARSLRDTLDSRLRDPNGLGFTLRYQPKWLDSALSKQEWDRLAPRLSNLLGSTDREASEWAVTSIAWSLPDPFTALPEVKRKLKHGDLRARADATAVLGLFAVRLIYVSTESKKLQVECEPCIPDLVRLLELREDDELLSQYPTLNGFGQGTWSGTPPELSRPDNVRSVVRANAAKAIGSLAIADEAVIAKLEKAANDSDEWVAYFADTAMSNIRWWVANTQN